MPKLPYRDIGVELNRDNRNKINDNFKDIASDLLELGSGAQIALEAADEATTQALFAQEQGEFANAEGTYASEQADYAKAQGEIAIESAGLADDSAAYATEQGDIAKQVANDNKTRFLTAVATVADRNTSYSNPAHGDTVRVTSESKTYRFVTGTGWVVTDQYNPTAIDNINAQLADIVTLNLRHYGAKVDGVTDDSVKVQQAIDYLSANGGGNVLFPKGTTLINQEINLKSNVNLLGIGTVSKIKTTSGSSQNGLNLLKAVEKSNITISNLYIENLGFGKSGSWEPAGSFDGAGACILAVGCDNFVVDNCSVINGGGKNGGEGVGNIYFSCCTNSKITNNFVSLCDNGICVDTWYNKIAGKEHLHNDGVVIQGNTVTLGGGRGIVIENVSTVKQKGSIVVNGNTINKMAYAGIQGNNTFNCIITNNAIDGDKTGRTGYGNSNDDMWYGIEFVSGTKHAVISGNTIQNIKIDGVRCFEAQDLIIDSNPIKNVLSSGIFIKNVNDDMYGVKVCNNNLDNVDSGIVLKKDSTDVSNLYDNSVIGNTVRFNRTATGKFGIEFNYHTLSKCDGNILKPMNTYGGSIGIKGTSTVKCSFNSNTISTASKGIELLNDIDSVSDSNLLEACSSAYKLDGCQRTSINSKFRGGTNAFEMVNGKVSTSQKCVAFNCDFDGVGTIKTGNGIIVKSRLGVVPTTNVCDVGDKVEMEAPTAGGYLGYVCVAQNSTNWKGYGLIQT